MKKLAVSIVLPTYNEEGNILRLIKVITNKLNKENIKNEIIVVDDNSHDKTYELVKKELNKNKNLKVFLRKKDKGLAKSIFFGIKKSLNPIIIVMDSDFNHDPMIIPQMVSLTEYYDLVIGSRYVHGGGMDDERREKASYLYNLFLRILLKTRVHDNLSGYFAMQRKDLKKLPTKNIFQGYGDYFIRLVTIASKEKMRIIEIPTWYKIRLFGESKSNFIKMILMYTKTALELKLKNSKKEHNPYSVVL